MRVGPVRFGPVRFGIALPRDGPLTEPAAVRAALAAAAELGYSSLWVPRAGVLHDAGTSGDAGIELALVLPTPSEDGGVRAGEVAAGEVGTVADLLTYVAGRPAQLAQVRPVLRPAVLLLDTSAAPDRLGSDGWAPLVASGVRLAPERRDDAWPRRVVVRMAEVPTDADLRGVLAARVDELVVALPRSADLDQQLAGFADIAERLAEAGQLAG